jgi:hypothetical protein
MHLQQRHPHPASGSQQGLLIVAQPVVSRFQEAFAGRESRIVALMEKPDGYE